MFLLQKFCRDLNSNLKEAYRKAVQESRGAVEDEEEDGAKADNKEQVIKIIPRMVKLIHMKIVIRNEDCNTEKFINAAASFQNRGSLKLRQDIAMSPEQNLVVLSI